MTISTKGRYGLRLLLDIALHQKEGGVVNLKAIAKRQEISVKYLWQIATPLKTAGLLLVSRGARGGFSLAKPPEKITLFDIVSTMEGPVMLVECGILKSCRAQKNPSRWHTCAARVIWSRLSNSVAQSMREITLREAMDIQENLFEHHPKSKAAEAAAAK